MRIKGQKNIKKFLKSGEEVKGGGINEFNYYITYDIDSKPIGNNILVISLYDEKKKNRFEELKTVLTLNISNIYLKKIVVLYERRTGLFDKFLKHDKIDVYIINKRPSYDDFFEICNNYYKNEICLVSNSDIIFTESLKNINLKNEKELYCLTRYNIIDYKINANYFKATYYYMRNHASQDVWIFKSPIKKMDTELLIGTFTCDSFINSYFINEKYKYINISDKVMALHLQNDITDSQINAQIKDSDVINVNNNEIVYKKDFISDYLNFIRKNGQRLSVCGINYDGNYFYPVGNNKCKKLKRYYNENLKEILWCPGCNECSWDKFFPQYLYDLDITYAEKTPIVMEFEEISLFKGIEHKNVKNIFKIKDNQGNIINFNINRNSLIFDKIVETDKFYIYFKHLFSLNLELKNFILYNDYGIIISGITKNTEPYLKKLKNNIDYIKLFFKNVKIFIYENDSTDNTKNVLEEYFNENEILCENNITDKKYNFHYSIMAIARNKCKDFINKQNDVDYPYVLLLDTDLHIDLSMLSIQSALNNKNRFDVQFANGVYLDKYYWDTFATRTKEKNVPFYYDIDTDGINKYWKIVTNTADAQKPIENEFTEVISAFGGMALYKKDCFKLSYYDPNVEDCEHVPFHEKLFKMGKKLVINRDFIKNYSNEETQGGYYHNL